MNQQERLQLDKLISQGDISDVTEDIRSKKHSPVLKREFESLRKMLEDRASGDLDLTTGEFSQACEFYAPFLYRNYTDLFNRAKKGDLDFAIMDKFTEVLGRIEEGLIDQHEGAHEVGTLLKKLYVDSALKRSTRIDAESAAPESAPHVEPVDVDYAHFKKRQQQIAEGKVRRCAKCGAETPVCELVRVKKTRKTTAKVCKNCV